MKMSEVVIADKTLHKKFLMAGISNGNPCVGLGSGISLRLTAQTTEYVTIQVVHHGIGVQPKTQSWIKSSVAKKATIKTGKNMEIQDKIEVEELL